MPRKGQIDEKLKQERLGQRRHNAYEIWSEIIEYNSSRDIVVLFDNGEKLKTNWKDFTLGVRPPSMQYAKHGDRHTKLNTEWRTMRWRCNPKNKRHHIWYSDKGIKVCKEWDVYINFKEWAMNDGFEEHLTIDRIDSDKDYCPENCRWLTKAENVRNIKYSKSWIPVLKYDLDGNFIERFPNVSKAHKSVNMSRGIAIDDCCKGLRDSFKGFRWEYED